MSIRVAYSNLACPDWTLAQMIDAAKQFDFEGIEFRLLNGETVPPDVTAAERERVATECKAAGVAIVGIGTSLRIASSATDADARLETERDAASYLELAYAWGAPLIRVYGGEPEGGKSIADVAEPAADLLAKIGQRAEQLGVTVGVETHDFVAASAVLMPVVEQVANEHVGVVWDLHHPYRMGESARETFERVWPRLLHVHVKDARRDKSERTGWELVPLGEGEVPAREAVTLLRNAGYDKWMTVEWEKKWHPEIAPPEIALPHDGAVLREWLTA